MFPIRQSDQPYSPRNGSPGDRKNPSERTASGKDAPTIPAIDFTADTTRTPWRHPHLLCPNCTGAEVTRVARHGVGDYLRSAIYIYPFKCEACGHGFRVFEWGVRYRRQRRF